MDESEGYDEYHEKILPDFFIKEIFNGEGGFYFFEIKLEINTLKNSIFNLSIEKETFSQFQNKKIIIAPQANKEKTIKTELFLSLASFEKLLSHQPLMFNV
ncbi:hypothetical protein [Marinomonas sp.]|uniref:hypothetical protein n=1 Tax=Marinomonas sp. TaxID=1904862 RepID=UPI003BA8A719